jgi:hypothetical protein
MSERHTCAHPDKFITALKDMFAAIDPERIRTQTGEVLQDMIEQLRQHEVSSSSTPRRAAGQRGCRRSRAAGFWCSRGQCLSIRG